MRFKESHIEGVWYVAPDPKRDERGSFSRSFCEREFQEAGLQHHFKQSSISQNIRTGTLRGLHYSNEPLAETKFVRCVRGAIFDVAVDVRALSPTKGRWFGVELSAENGLGLYIAAGIAHGFQTLQPNSDVLYQITPEYQAGYDAGVRWNDPAFNIAWPIVNPFMSQRDANYPDWTS